MAMVQNMILKFSEKLARLVIWVSCFLPGALCGQGVIRSYTYQYQGVFSFYISFTGDVDGDGLRDMAVWLGGQSVHVVSPRTGQSIVTVSPQVPMTVTGVGSRMGDVDGDFLDDLMLRSYDGTRHYLQVASGITGAVLFTRQVQFPSTAEFIPIGDLNGNGTADLLLGEPQYSQGGMNFVGSVEVIDGGTWATIRTHTGWFADQYMGYVHATGDMDGDGVEDYAISGNNGEFWGFSGATGGQIWHIAPSWGWFGYQVQAIGDFNADGYDDLVITDNPPMQFSNYLAVHVLGGPNATPLWQYIFYYNNPGPYYWPGPIPYGVPVDLDHDGHQDLLMQWGASGVLMTAISGRDLSLLRESPQAAIGSPGDMDGDGVPDILVQAPGSPSGGTITYQLVSGRPPGVTWLGGGCPSPSGASPRLGTGIGARVGRTLTVNLSEAPSTTLWALLAVGFSSQQWGSTPLPLDLQSYGLPGCHWRIGVEASFVVPTLGGNGLPHRATHEVQIPTLPALLGTQLHWQWLVAENAFGGLGGAVSDAVRTTIVP